MPGVHEQVREAVSAIGGWLAHSPNPGEAIVRQAIVLRLLHAAGFDIWNPAEVVPEETNASGNRSDFLIRAGAGKFALEIKGAGVALRGKPYEQVITYAAGEGTRWAMLTNGKVWVVLDRMHNPGGTFADHEVLKLEMNQEGHTFADDLAALLDAKTWRADAFAGAVQGIRNRQEQRLDEARIRREKTTIVEDIRSKYRIPTFELAAEAAVEMNSITEAERDVLLGVPMQKAQAAAPPIKTRRQPPAPMLQPYHKTPQSGDTAGEIHFTYRILGAEAHAVYRPADGTWTVKAGSTALQRVGASGQEEANLAQRRIDLLGNGTLGDLGANLLRYERDFSYSSPSQAAGDIEGQSWHRVNGWDVWKDSQGRPARHYRPQKPQSD